ncbi:hypothetical protein SIL77_13510 [Exiguobacterium profundum]|uniref:hypothetical protein n=1 Tax=Exiguobacterium profundum TaxID=307643 RepID=UPI0029C17B7F|nr:hypothetical protein [Exiguobacterium profundum]MDX5982276.1 hypothetical protein [Exiguobacterium profundum]
MSKLLSYDLVSESKARITSIHYKPELLSEEEVSNGILVDFLPSAVENGKNAVLYYDLSTKELFYEYEEKQALPEQEELAKLKAENQALNTAVVELYEIVLGGI